MTTKQMKEIYEANPDEWIALWSATIGWMKHGAWLKTSTPAFIDENHYKLIHIKHKDILSAWLADNSVEIEFRYGIGTKFESTWNTSSYFIENYNPDLEYRLRDKSSWCKECNMYKRDCICRIKEKEDVKTLSKQSSQSISSELSDSSNTSDIGLPNINKRQGKGGWRLPKIEELLSIVDYTTHNPASTADITSGHYWSSTIFARHTSYAWAVHFDAGNSDYYAKHTSRYVCCVRDTQDGLEWGEETPARMTWDEATVYAEGLNNENYNY